MSIIEDHAVLPLRGRRHVEYVAKGDPDGMVVAHFHGQPGVGDLGLSTTWLALRGVLFLGVNRPGYGRTSPMGKRSVADANADWLSVFERARLSSRQLVVIGNSGGGLYAAAFAAQHPELVKHLFLMGSAIPEFAVATQELGSTNATARLKSEDEFRLYALRMAASVRRNPYAQIEELKVDSLLTDPRHPDRICYDNDIVRTTLAWMARQSLHGPHGVSGWLEDFTASRQELGFYYSSIPPTVPTTIIHGMHDPFTPVSNAAWLQQSIWHAETMILERCGHIAMLCNIPRVMDLLIHGVAKERWNSALNFATGGMWPETQSRSVRNGLNGYEHSNGQPSLVTT